MTRAMKDSGIEWIGEMPQEWHLLRMKNCFISRDSGSWGDEPTGEEGDMICLRIADFDYSRFRFKDIDINALTKRHYERDVINKLTLQKHDILIEKSGGGDKTPVGRTVIFDKDYLALFANFMDRLRCSTSVSPVFMQYVLSTFYKNEYTRNYIKQTTGIQNLDLTSMLSSEFIPVPSQEEQCRIAVFLDHRCSEIDSVIADTQKSIEEYKTLKHSIITEAVTHGVSGPRKMKYSGVEWLGELPEEWECKPIKKSFSVVSGATPKSEIAEYWDGDIAWITPADYKTTDRYVTVGKRNISQKGYDSCGTTIVPIGSIVFSKRAPIGTVAITKSALCTNQGCLSCIPNQGTDAMFFYYAMSVYTEQFCLFGTGTTFKEISYRDFSNFILPLPPISEQQQIADYLNRRCTDIDQLIETKQSLLTDLASYKKSVIYEYVTGKKEVPYGIV